MILYVNPPEDGLDGVYGILAVMGVCAIIVWGCLYIGGLS